MNARRASIKSWNAAKRSARSRIKSSILDATERGDTCTRLCVSEHHKALYDFVLDSFRRKGYRVDIGVSGHTRLDGSRSVAIRIEWDKVRP